MSAPTSLLALPREIRDLISTFLISTDRSASIVSTSNTAGETSAAAIIRCSSIANLAATCLQVRSECLVLARRYIIRYGVPIVVQVHNFDFRVLMTFVKSLSPWEITQLNRHRGLLVQLVFFGPGGLEEMKVKGLRDWVVLCEQIGLEAGYRTKWTGYRRSQQLSWLGRWREGGKVLQVLEAMAVESWSWQAFVRRMKEDSRV